MKCNKLRPGFEQGSPCPFPMTITIMKRYCWIESRSQSESNIFSLKSANTRRYQGREWGEIMNRYRKLTQTQIVPAPQNQEI